MATKTITITTDAYELLRDVRKDNESFSETIRRVVPRRPSPKEFAKMLKSIKPLSPETIRGLDEMVRTRRQRSRKRA